MSSDLKHLVREGQRLRFRWVETFTSVFAFLNVVVISIGAAGCISLVGCTIISQIFSLDEKNIEILWYSSLVCGLSIGIAFTFAVILFLGMYQNKPSFVLMYFIFGVALNLVLVLCMTSLQYNIVRVEKIIQETCNDNFYVVIGVCGVYALVLVMVGWTYVLMTLRERKQKLKVEE